MANVLFLIVWAQMNMSNPVVYSYLTLASEICGALRVIPAFYITKVCIDVVRESMKVYIINR